MDELVSYSLLSTIRNKQENVTSLIEVYRELTEGLLAELNTETHGKGLLTDLKKEFDNKYNITIPFPTLKIILMKISKSKKTFQLFTDQSFIHDMNDFEDLKDIIEEETDIIEEIKQVYNTLCIKAGIKAAIGIDYFIKLNQRELIQFLNDGKGTTNNSNEFEIFKTIYSFEKYKGIIDKLVFGSILASYIDLNLVDHIIKKVLLLDTNFIVSLLDLHTVESNTTCEEILLIAKKSKFSIEVLPETIKEVQNLLRRKSYHVDCNSTFININKHTIESGCKRKNINGNDLNLIGEKLERTLGKKGILVLSLNKNKELYKSVKTSEIYDKIKKRPFNKEGIIHDAMAMNYVKSIRKKDEKGFADTSSFFVTDTQGFVEKKISTKTELPHVITAEELLNILWLSNPTSNSLITSANVSNIFSKYLQKKLPDKKMLSALDKKINSLARFDIDLKDCADLAVNISVDDTKSIQDFVDCEEVELIKIKLEKLTKEAENRKNNELKESIQRSNNVFNIISSKWNNEKKNLKQKDIEINEFREIIGDKSKQIVKLEDEKDSVISNLQLKKVKDELVLKKDLLENNLERDKDENNFYKKSISDRNNLIFSIISKTTMIISIILLIIIGYFGVKYIIPNWNIIEPAYFLMCLAAPIIIYLLRFILPNFKIVTLVEIIIMKLFENYQTKTSEMVERQIKIDQRIQSTISDLNNIIL